jgi:hypothetical protein
MPSRGLSFRRVVKVKVVVDHPMIKTRTPRSDTGLHLRRAGLRRNQ